MSITKRLHRKTRETRRHLLVEGLELRALMAGFNFADFSNSAALNLEGNAAISADGHLRLTPAAGSTAGAAWYAADKEFVAGQFSTTFQFQLANNFDSPGGSDGFVFAIQNTNPTFLGSTGQSLGYNGLADSLAVEFDTFQNSGLGDTSQSSISVHTGGTAANSVNESYSLGHFDTNQIMDDGAIHTAKIDYQVGVLSIYLDNLTSPVLNVSVDLADKLHHADGLAWVGFTAATGGGYQTHDVINWNFSVPVVPATILSSSDASQIEGNSGSSNLNFTINRMGD